MRRSIFKAGVWTALGLAIAFAVVSANSNARHAATTAAEAPHATVASAASHDECASSDVCCARETKVGKTAVAAAPKKAVNKAVTNPPSAIVAGTAGMVVVKDESGMLTVPTAEQINELKSQVVAPDEPGTTIHFANGAVGTTAAGATDYVGVRIDATGKRILVHGDATQPAKPALEEK